MLVFRYDQSLLPGQPTERFQLIVASLKAVTSSDGHVPAETMAFGFALPI
jgi:hypothetical protein